MSRPLSNEELEHRVNAAYLLGAEEDHLSRRYGLDEEEIEDYLEYEDRELSLPGEISLDIVDQIYSEWKNLDEAMEKIYSENDGLALPKFDIKQTLKEAELRGGRFKDYETVENDLDQGNRVPTSPPWTWHVGIERETPYQGGNPFLDIIMTRDYPLGIGEEEALKWYKENVNSDPSEEELKEFREEVVEPAPDRGLIETASNRLFSEVSDKEARVLQETVDGLTVAAQDKDHHAFRANAEKREEVDRVVKE
ncbi:MAG: ubiquitin-conjugating enzyme E2 variant [Candidatus Nanohalobium sp.]